MTNPTRFKCPTCSAGYQVVRVDAGSTGPAAPANDRELTCPVCRGPLRARDGQFIFKYFLVRRPGEAERPTYHAG